MPHQNRAILLTAPGAGAIAVVRIVGQEVLPFLRSHFARPVAEGRCIHADLGEPGRVIDDAVVVLHNGGLAADLNLHGGRWVVQSTLELLQRCGFDVIPHHGGPLPEEAVDGQSLFEREILSHLPLARTEPALRALLAQKEAWRNPVRTLEEIRTDRALFHLLHPPRVAIVGIPNTGKSTLANQLFAQERSITADVPGTTRDWVGELANIDGLAVLLVDTPGQRETADPIEREAIQRSAPQIQAADLVLLLLDPTQDAETQAGLVRRYPGAVVVMNKADLASGRSSILYPLSSLRVSARTGEGMAELRQAILGRFGCKELDPRLPRCWTARQFDLTQRAADLGDVARCMLKG